MSAACSKLWGLGAPFFQSTPPSFPECPDSHAATTRHVLPTGTPHAASPTAFSLVGVGPGSRVRSEAVPAFAQLTGGFCSGPGTSGSGYLESSAGLKETRTESGLLRWSPQSCQRQPAGAPTPLRRLHRTDPRGTERSRSPTRRPGPARQHYLLRTTAAAPMGTRRL